MKNETINKLGNLEEYDDFKELCTIFLNIELMIRLKKKGFKTENKFAGYRAS